MKRMKSGFTLAEVLITLGIIGVVAAIVMPSVVTSYQFKTVGVKLSKFASQLEGVARPYVVQNRNIDNQDIANLFVSESFLIMNSDAAATTKITCKAQSEYGDSDQDQAEKAACTGKEKDEKADFPSSLVTEAASIVNGTATEGRHLDVEDQPAIRLKDGTVFKAYYSDAQALLADTVNQAQVGAPAVVISFDPVVNGMPKATQKAYDFVVTELGYVYPSAQDPCLSGIFASDFITNSSTYSTGSACVGEGSTNTGGND